MHFRVHDTLFPRPSIPSKWSGLREVEEPHLEAHRADEHDPGGGGLRAVALLLGAVLAYHTENLLTGEWATSGLRFLTIFHSIECKISRRHSW